MGDPKSFFGNATVVGADGKPAVFEERPAPAPPPTGQNSARRTQGLVLVADRLGTVADRSPAEWMHFLDLRRKLLNKAKATAASDVTVIHGGTSGTIQYSTSKVVPWGFGFSDTVAICFEVSMDPPDVLRAVGQEVQALFLAALGQGDLLRGAAACGEFYADGEIVCGPAVNEAGKLFDLADWAGIVLGPSTGKSLDPGLNLEPTFPFRRWSVPLHVRHSAEIEWQELWALDWATGNGKLFLDAGLWAPTIEDTVLPLFGANPHPPEDQKRRNTLAFIRGMQRAQSERTLEAMARFEQRRG
ncbi:MAG: hypothetical protein L3K18_08725 [Thermoplasmata archaeon]|nr:hypothetical protein [Thermoplasmata archaeon]